MNPTTKGAFAVQRFHVFDVSLELVRSVRGVIEVVGQQDRALAGQLRRAAASVPANIAEGNRRAGRDRRHLWRVAAGSADEVCAHLRRVAAGSADEVCAHLRVAEAWGYVGGREVAEVLALADRVLAMLWRLCGGRR
jgi:hypothetical protein